MTQETTNYQQTIMSALMRRSHSLYWGTVRSSVIKKRRAIAKLARKARRKNR